MRPPSLLLLASAALLSAFAGCSLPEYAYNDDAFARASQGGGGAGGDSQGGAGQGGQGGNQSGHSGTGGVSGKGGQGGQGGHGGAPQGGQGGQGGQSAAGGQPGAGQSQGGQGNQGGAGVGGTPQGGQGGEPGGHPSEGGAGMGGEPGGSGPAGAGQGGEPGGSNPGGAGQGGTPQGGMGGSSTDLTCTVARYTFDQCPGSFTTTGSKAAWGCGAPSGGPGGDHTTGSGSLWAANLNGKPNYCEDSFLQSPAIDLTKLAGKSAKLRFWFWGEFSGCDPNGDPIFHICQLPCSLSSEGESGGVLEVMVGGNWQVIEPSGGYPGNQKILVDGTVDNGGNGGTTSCQNSTLEEQRAYSSKGPNKVWTQAVFDISSYVAADFQFRFHFASDDQDDPCYHRTAGWFVDDIDIGSDTPCP